MIRGDRQTTSLILQVRTVVYTGLMASEYELLPEPNISINDSLMPAHFDGQSYAAYLIERGLPEDRIEEIDITVNPIRSFRYGHFSSGRLHEGRPQVHVNVAPVPWRQRTANRALAHETSHLIDDEIEGVTDTERIINITGNVAGKLVGYPAFVVGSILLATGHETGGLVGLSTGVAGNAILLAAAQFNPAERRARGHERDAQDWITFGELDLTEGPEG